MATHDDAPKGPDLAAGFPLADLPDGQPFVGHVNGEPVVVVRRGDAADAIGGTCTHYGGPLGEGLVTGDTIHCPWHHACFSLRTGEATGAPALNPVPVWEVEVRDATVYLGARRDGVPLATFGRHSDGPASVVIVGAGAAGSAAAETLRAQGYGGPISMVDPDTAAPYDRPNLSKDYLAGHAPEEWIPLRPENFYAEHGITRIDEPVDSLDARARTVRLRGGRMLEFGALLLATGSTPIRPNLPGIESPRVFTLRSLADCRAIIEAVGNATNAVVLGASFIGMEVAASLRERGLEVTVVAPEAVPFERVLGRGLGEVLLRVHEDHGTRFRLGRTASAIEDEQVVLDDGSRLPADLVVVGVGVRPTTAIAEAAGLDVDNGVLVDRYLRTSAEHVFAAGDIARYPDPRSGERIRVEHWVAAQRQGQAAARNILGQRRPFEDPPFFWCRHWDVVVQYVGHASAWDALDTDGSLPAHDVAVRYVRDGRVDAVATIGRDLEGLTVEAEMARGD